MMREVSLRRRLTLALVLVFILGLVVSTGFFYWQTYGYKTDISMRTLRGQARDFLAHLRLSDAVELTLPPAWDDVYRRTGSGFFFTLYDAERRPRLRSSNLTAPLPFIPLPTGAAYSRLQFGQVEPMPTVLIAARAPGDHVLVVGRRQPDLEPIAESLLEENFEYLLLLVPFILVLVLLGVISDWSLRPLARAAQEAARIGPANPDQRIAVSGLPREAKPLIDAVNGALDRLADAYVGERRLTADAAHALRTPLTVLSLRLQQTQFGAGVDWPAVEQDLAELKRLVDQLLDLARKENPVRVAAAEPVNLTRLAREVAAQVLPRAEQTGRLLEVDASGPVSVRGYANDLRDLLLNLVDNALVHGRGTVTIALREVRRADRNVAVIAVSDQGSGIAEAESEAIFERFHKSEPASPGAGLGLAIVRQVARSHGGEVRVVAGDGGRFEVSLPAPRVIKGLTTT